MMAVTPAGFFSAVPVWPDAVAGETEAARDFTGSKAFLFLRSQRIISLKRDSILMECFRGGR